jgi:3-oxoadipate enol-lactonase
MMPHVEANGERLFYVAGGEGPPVVLVHSLGSSVHMWRDLISDLCDAHKVVAFDCRGHGRSTNRGGFTVSAVADDLVAVADELGLEPFHLAGISMGGLIAVTFCSRYPERVRSLVLADSYAHFGAGARDRINRTRQVLETVSMLEFGERYASETLMPGTPAEVHRELAETIGRMSPEDYLETLESILTEDVNPLLGRVGVPTLVPVGEEDRRAPVALSEHLARSIPRAELRVIPEAGHLSNLDQPEVFSVAVKAFLEAQVRSDEGSQEKEESR